MKRLVINPAGWPCTLEECPPGMFIYSGSVCFKSEYINEGGGIQAFCDTGEAFIAGLPMRRKDVT